MPSSVAEVYMLMFNPAGIPVIGEAWALPFNGQVQIDDLSWTLTPPIKEQAETDQAAAESDTPAEDDGASGGRPQLARPESAPPFDGDALIQAVRRMQGNARYTQQQRDIQVRRLIQRATQEHDAARDAVDERNSQGSGRRESDTFDPDEHDLTFNFSKNADAATSQILRGMAKKLVFPKVIVTVFHRSLHAPMTLLLQFDSVRFKSYSLECRGEELMSDITERWVASYKGLTFTYQNRPPLGLPYSIASGVALATTQGRIKEFTMTDRDDRGQGVF